MKLPFQRTYWAVPGQLLAGCYPGHLSPVAMEKKLAGLLESKVTLVLNLMEAEETDHCGRPFANYTNKLISLASEAGHKIRVERFPIRDMSIPTIPQMQSILQTMELEIQSGGIVFVHCWGGKGRTGTVVGSYLLSKRLETPDSVLDKLTNLTAHEAAFFHPTPQTMEQRRFVKNWNP